MALLSICGFEAADAIEAGSALAGTASIQSTVKRTGGYALQVNPTTTGTGAFTYMWPDATGKIFNQLTGIGTFWHRFYFRVDTLPAANDEEIELCLGNGAPAAYGLRITSGGVLKLYRDEVFGGAPSVVATGTTALSTGTFYRIEWKLGNGATAPYEVKIGGLSEFSGTTDTGTTTLWQYFIVGKYSNKNGQSVNFYYDDLAVNDAAYPGVGEVHILKPRAAGASAQWATGTSALFSAVNEVPNDGDTSYIKDSTSGDVSSFAMDSSATGGVLGNIAAVQIVAVCRDEGGASSIKVRLRNGSTNRDATGVASMGTTYRGLARIDATDPNTGAAWTSGGLDTIEAGVVNGASVAARCTAIYAMVECAGSSEPYPAGYFQQVPQQSGGNPLLRMARRWVPARRGLLIPEFAR